MKRKPKKEIKMPFVKKWDNGMNEINNGMYSIYCNDETLKIFEEMVKKEGEKYAATNRK